MSPCLSHKSPQLSIRYLTLARLLTLLVPRMNRGPCLAMENISLLPYFISSLLLSMQSLRFLSRLQRLVMKYTSPNRSNLLAATHGSLEDPSCVLWDTGDSQRRTGEILHHLPRRQPRSMRRHQHFAMSDLHIMALTSSSIP